MVFWLCDQVPRYVVVGPLGDWAGPRQGIGAKAHLLAGLAGLATYAAIAAGAAMAIWPNAVALGIHPPVWREISLVYWHSASPSCAWMLAVAGVLLVANLLPVWWTDGGQAMRGLTQAISESDLAWPHRRRRLSRRIIARVRRQAFKEQLQRRQIDEILAKVSAHGLPNLTWLDRHRLHKATQRSRRSDSQTFPTQHPA